MEKLDLNIDYIKSIDGILKVAQVVLDLICVGLGGSGKIATDISKLFPGHACLGSRSWHLTACISALLITLTVLFFYLLKIHEKITQINWKMFELVFNAIYAVTFLIAAIALMSTCSGIELKAKAPGFGTTATVKVHADEYIAAGVFDLIAAGLYAFAAFLGFKKWQAKNADVAVEPTAERQYNSADGKTDETVQHEANLGANPGAELGEKSTDGYM